MCFRGNYRETTSISSDSRIRESSLSSKFFGGFLSGCFGHDDLVVVRNHPRRRYGHRRSYYPASYYAQDPPRVVHGSPHYHGGHLPRHVYGGFGTGYGGGITGRAAMPSRAAMRSYYTAGVAAPAYSYAYQTMAPAVAVPVATTYTSVGNQVPVTTSSGAYSAGEANRVQLQEGDRVLAHRRGAYNPKYIKPADARPDDTFWCQERTGEWHMRSFYQIENECYPGEWLMDPQHGYLCFHRR